MRTRYPQSFKALFAAIVVLTLFVTGLTSIQAQPTGAVNGLFSVSQNQQVYFSKGNLQYRASTNTWRFADHQWDILGLDNQNISSSYSGWIDLFGWGTSGYNHGAVCYQPWSTSEESGNYLAYGYESASLEDYSGTADWGYNRISNGGNQLQQWKTLTAFELAYVVAQRTTASGLRFAKATVNGVKGLILLPDDWSTSYYALNSANDTQVSTDVNVISSSNWQVLEQHGAVFLPFGNYRYGTYYYNNASIGYYMSYYATTTSYNSHDFYAMIMAESPSTNYITFNHVGKCMGANVRLAYPVAPTATVPTVHTESVSNVTAFNATVQGHVSSDGGATVTERGICWSTGYSPTINGSHTASGSGLGQYSVTISNLEPNTTYHAKAYAINSQGVSYGERVNFTTAPVLPELTIAQPIVLTTSSVSVSCGITTSGATSVTECGVCWSTSHNPTITSSHLQNSSVNNSYSLTINGLNVNTTYYVRAYARNSYGVGYSEEQSFVIPSYSNWSEGLLQGLFSVNGVQKVRFSQGNLQYQATTNQWRFATLQWDVVGLSNSQISQNYGGWIDLFAWGANGVAHADSNYEPWSSSYEDCIPYNSTQYELNDYTGIADWGYNAITNGGNQQNQWNTLTYAEFMYLLTERSTTSGIRFVKACVNGVNGIILLPDNWNTSYYGLANANDESASYEGNMISAYNWVNSLESHGCVFLPAAGIREATTVYGLNSNADYWTASSQRISFEPQGYGFSTVYHHYGQAVRLVKHNTMKVKTMGAGALSQTSMNCFGEIVSVDGNNVTEKGVYINGNHVSAGSGTGQYSVVVSGLSANQTYTMKAYAKRNGVTVYGGKWIVSTLPVVPRLTTDDVMYVTETSAACGGYVYPEGDIAYETGVCWSTHPNPTVNDSHVATASPTLNSHYVLTMNGLSANTTYYVRAYALNNGGAGYGNEVTFVTQRWHNGILPGSFSVGNNQSVQFSQGNLRYQASTDTWRFADKQWDCIGTANNLIASVYGGSYWGHWIDLFGWATATYPANHETTHSFYYAYGDYQYNLYDQDGSKDWGSNPVQNGGNTAYYWRTLSQEEWYYIIETRTTPSNIRYCLATVNSFKGVILFPDDWSTSYYSITNANGQATSFEDNVITSSSWNTYFEAHGAVFLPAAGWRLGTTVGNVNEFGHYWTSSSYNYDNAYSVTFLDGSVFLGPSGRAYGQSVRLVRGGSAPVNPSVTENVTLNPGWNWISNLSATEQSIADVLTGLTPANGDMIKGQQAYCTYNASTGQWTGALGALSPGKSYIYLRNGNSSVSYNAQVATSQSITISINPGWNWISYPLGTEKTVEEALSNLTPANGDILKGQHSYCTYNASTGHWTGALSTMVPGEGYIYLRNANTSTSFTY